MARRLGVSRGDIVAAAVRVCDREGLAGLTVAAVAAEVGCRPPSVYHHVDGLDGLLRAVTFVAAEQLVAVLEAAEDEAEPTDALARMMDAAHDWGVRHPGRYDALRRPVDTDAEPELAAARSQLLLPVQDALVALGVPAERRPALVAAVVATVRGCIAADLDAGADPDEPSTGARTAGRQLLVRLLLDHVATVRGEDDGIDLASTHADGDDARATAHPDDATPASP